MKTILSRYRVRNAALAGGLAVLGAILVAVYVASYRHSVTHGAGLVSVYVAAHDIPQGMQGSAAIGSGGLKKETVLQRNVVGGAITNPSQIAGLAATQTVFAGEQITIRQFNSAATQGALGALSGNLRAITIPGNSYQLLAGIVQPGDHVDMLANVHYSIGGTSHSITRVILSNLYVLYAPGAGSSGGLTSTSNSDSNSITFAVSEQQAEKIFFATQNSSWALALRPTSHPSDSSQTVESMQNLVGDGLGQKQISQLTNGQGLGSVNNGG